MIVDPTLPVRPDDEPGRHRLRRGFRMPCPMSADSTARPRFAIIHIKPDVNTQAWPIDERVPGGWQSGVHHYPDRDVISVKPLHLAPPTGPTARETPAAELAEAEKVPAVDGDGGAGR